MQIPHLSNPTITNPESLDTLDVWMYNQQFWKDHIDWRQKLHLTRDRITIYRFSSIITPHRLPSTSPGLREGQETSITMAPLLTSTVESQDLPHHSKCEYSHQSGNDTQFSPIGNRMASKSNGWAPIVLANLVVLLAFTASPAAEECQEVVTTPRVMTQQKRGRSVGKNESVGCLRPASRGLANWWRAICAVPRRSASQPLFRLRCRLPGLRSFLRPLAVNSAAWARSCSIVRSFIHSFAVLEARRTLI